MSKKAINTGYPSAVKQYLKRQGLEDLLKNAFKKPLTTVVAGAGYGKTQTVLAALKATEYAAAWMQLGVLDNHVARFWENFANSFEKYSPGLCESLLSIGYPESIAAFDQFLRLLAKGLPQTERFVLVLDDFHLINTKTILDFVELLISTSFQGLSIVLISRKKPDFSPAVMQYKEHLAQITEDDLRFSKEEMALYYHNQSLELGEKMLSDIYSYTEGWIFAIYLVGLAAQKGDISYQNPVLTAKLDIFGLIEKEVFMPASKQLQDFLVKIAILDNIPSGLLYEMASSSLVSEMLQLSRFVRYNSFSDSYRIHNLFKEFLLERKGKSADDECREVHLTAARWYEKNDRKPEAISHYKECGRYNEIFDIILSYTYHVAQETAELFIELINEAPEEIIREKPVLRVVKANYMFNNNEIAEAKQELTKIREEYEALPRTNDNLAVLGEAYITLALISIVNSDYEFEELFKKAALCLPNGSRLVDDKLNIAEGLNVCNIKDPSEGELKRHQDALINASPYAVIVMNGCGYGLECLNAAESGLYVGDLKSAEKYAYEAIYKSRQFKQYDIEYMANFVLIRILTAKGNYDRIAELLSQMKTQMESLRISRCFSLYDVIEGWFFVKIGNTDSVAKWIKYEEETRKTLAPVILGREYLVRSDCLLAEERYYELLAFMKQTDKQYESRGILFATIQNKITKAIVHHYMGNFAESMNMLNEAYELTHPNNLTMQYIEYGNRMRTLIHAAKQDENCKIPADWLNKIYSKSSSYAKMLSRIVVSYNAAHEIEDAEKGGLSKRESEVLLYLYRGMTRGEIAATCYLSLSTVNSVLRSIFAKLGAANAVDAVRIAKEKHLL